MSFANKRANFCKSISLHTEATGANDTAYTNVPTLLFLERQQEIPAPTPVIYCACYLDILFRYQYQSNVEFHDIIEYCPPLPLVMMRGV